MRTCQYCGKELSRRQAGRNKKYCGLQCAADSRYGKKIEWNGVRMHSGKTLEVLKLCCAGMMPEQACQAVGAELSTIKRLKRNREAAKLLSKRACPVCGKDVPPPLNRKYCGKNCYRAAHYARIAAARGSKRRLISYERRQKALELYQQGFDRGSIAQLVSVPQQTVKNWLHCSRATKSYSPLHRQLENAKTADEWAKMLRNSASATERSDTVILVCAKLHASGAPGRYIGIAAEQFWQEGFYNGVCVAFCNILKDSITTIEWRGENFYLTRTLKTAGAFVWPDEKLGRSIEVTRVEFDYLISLKKNRKKHVKSIKKITE